MNAIYTDFLAVLYCWYDDVKAHLKTQRAGKKIKESIKRYFLQEPNISGI